MNPYKGLLAILCVSLAILAFQNCGSDQKVNNLVGADAETTFITGHSLQALNFEVSPDSEFGFEYNLDLKTGRLFTEGQEYCLSDEIMDKIFSKIEGDQICNYEGNTNPSLVCSTIYQHPYAEIVLNDTQIRLQEMASSCSDTTDFCNKEDEIEFRGLLERIHSDLSDYVCP